MTITHVYECVDSTDEETYYPIGIWLTLDEAVAALSSITDPSDIGDQEYEDYAKFEIRERGVGKTEWSGAGRVVYEHELEYHWPDDDDADPEWRVRTPARPVGEEGK